MSKLLRGLGRLCNVASCCDRYYRTQRQDIGFVVQEVHKYPLLLYPYPVTDCLYLEEIKAISVAILKILNLGSYRNRNIFHINLLQIYRLFTVLYFSVRSSRSSALCHRLPSCMSVNRPLAGTSENQDTRDGKTRYNRGL